MSIAQLEDLEGGVNGWKIAGRVLFVIAGVGECAIVAFSWGGVATAAGGVGCIIDGLNE